jgi:hypothetical protein
MNANPHAILDSPHKLRVCVGGWRGEVAPAGFAIHREHAAQRQLKASTVTPGADRVGEINRLRAALHADPPKRVWHEALAEAGVDGTEHQIGIGRPNQI